MRYLLALPQAAAAALMLATTPGPLAVVAACLLLADAAMALLPWRPPRKRWSARKLWTEASLYLLPGAVLLVAAFVAHAAWLGRPGSWLAWPAAVAAGAGAVALSRMRLRALATGKLARLAGPARDHRARVRLLSTIAAPLVEEPLFRGVLLAASVAWYPALAPLLAVAFVLRHHIRAGADPLAANREFAVRLALSVVITGLAWWTGSLWPSVLAHAIANAPVALLTTQRLLIADEDADNDLPLPKEFVS